MVKTIQLCSKGSRTYVYLFFDVHHAMFDGGSFRLLLEDIATVYLGGALRPDYYYMMLERRERDRGSELYQESRRYFDALYNDGDWTTYPKPDRYTRENRLGELTLPLALDMERLKAAEAALHVGHNEFFIGAALMAVAVYNQSNHVMLSWIYNGRDDKDMLSTVSLLYRDLPVAIRFEDCADIHALYAQVREQVRGGIVHSCCPYVERGVSADNKVVSCVLYQRSMGDPVYIGDVRMKPIEIRQNRDASQTILDIRILEREEGLELGFDYISTLYEQSSMERFGKLLIRVAREMTRAVLEDEHTDMAELLERVKE